MHNPVRSTSTESIFCSQLSIDDGREHSTGKMKKIIKRENIWVETAPSYTPEINGVAECVTKKVQLATL